MIKEGQVITLDDNKDYIVLKKLNLHSVNYVYLVTIEKPTEILIVTEKQENGKMILEEIKDNDELDYILSQFVFTKEENDEID